MMRLRFTILITVLSISGSVFAQDPHFSQFFASPLTLNPALTGRFDGNMRIAGNYRNQWPTISNAFQTYTASVDFAILQNKLPEIDRWAGGIMALGDQQADGVLKNTYYAFSTAYHKGLDEDGYHQVAVGFQGTFAQKRLNTTNLKFEDQLRSDGFTGITAEIFNPANVNINYFDLNAGVMFSGVTGGSVSYYAGGSIYHINKPRESFTGADFALQPRYTFHGGAYFPVGQTTVLHTSALYQNQSGASETVIGGAFGLTVNPADELNPTTFYAGSWYRFGDAIIPYIGLEFNSMRVGASYDVNTSALKSVSQSRGGFELSLIYVHRPNTDRPLNCPRF
jgi:type IX secretion system PorP/SprF family membrane protein